jgi:outer membrane protein assembly factor BamB
MTTTGMVVGSPGFMSPEQASGQVTGPAGDVFCLASVMVFAATGRAPFDGSSATGLLYQVVHTEPDLTGLPAALAAIIGPCFVKDPAARPTAWQVAAAFAPEGGAAAILGDGWLPSDLAGAIARHAATVLQMDAPPQATRVESTTTLAGGRHGAPRATEPDPARRRLLLGSVAAGAVALVGGGAVFELAGRPGGKATGGSTASPAAVVKSSPSVKARPSSLPSGVAPDPIWTAALKSPVDTEPIVAGNRVLVKTDNDGLTPFSATMTALDVNSGKQLWDFPAIFNEQFPPVVIGNFALTLLNDQNNGNLVVLDLASGKAVKTVAPSDSNVFLGLLAATPTTAYILGQTSKNPQSPYALLAYDLRSGKQLWSHSDGNQQIDASLGAVAAGADLITADTLHHVSRRSTGSGAPLWNVDLGHAQFAASQEAFLAVSAQRGVAISARSTLIGWDLATAAKRWEITGPDRRDAFAPPVVSADGTTVYAVVTGPPGFLLAIDARAGTRKWDVDFTDGANHRPVLAGGMCFFSYFTTSGQTGLYAIDTGTGVKRWTFTDASASNNEWRLAGAPAAGMLVARHDSTLLALPAIP